MRNTPDEGIAFIRRRGFQTVPLAVRDPRRVSWVIDLDDRARDFLELISQFEPMAGAHRPGKTQTYLPWDSWQHPYVLDQPSVWFHEVLRPDGTPYREAEVNLIRQLTGKR